MQKWLPLFLRKLKLCPMKNYLTTYKSMTSLIALAIVLLVACEQEAQVKPNGAVSKTSTTAGAEQTASVTFVKTTFSPGIGIPGVTKVQLVTSLWQYANPAEVIVTFAGCPDDGVPCDGIVAPVLNWSYISEDFAKFEVVVPIGAVTGKITFADNDGGITSTSDFKVRQIPGAGLVAFYPFDNNTDDVSGNGLNGIAYGATKSTDRSGNPNSAYFFDGQDDFISMGNPAQLQLTGKMTITAWIQSASTGTFAGPIVSKNSGSTTGYDLRVSLRPGDQTRGVNLRLFPKLGACNSFISGNLLSLQWTFVAATVDGSLVKIYQNGQLVNTSMIGCGLTNDGLVDFKIGKGVGVPLFHGNIDNVAVYNRALSHAEVMQMFQNPD
jgi:hypothetical protein